MKLQKNASVLPMPFRQVAAHAIRLRGIRVSSHMGVSSTERASPQELVVAIDLDLAGECYPLDDEIGMAADYAEIVRIVGEEALGPGDRLLETFALRVARRLGERWPSALQIRVGVTKAIVPTALPVDEASVEVTFGKGRA